MSTADRVYSGLKAIMLMNERFDRVDERIKELGTDLVSLSGSHAELAQRVARIEGVMEGYGRASGQRQLPEA